MSIFSSIKKYFEEKEYPSLREKREAIFQDEVLKDWTEKSKTSLEALSFLMKIRGNYITSDDYATRAIPEEIPEERIVLLNSETARAIGEALDSGDSEIRRYALEQLWHIDEIGAEKKCKSLMEGVKDGTIDLEKDLFIFACPVNAMYPDDAYWADEILSFVLDTLKGRIEYVKENPVSRGEDRFCSHLIFYLKQNAEEFPAGAKYLQEIAEDPLLQKIKIVREIYS